MNQMTLTFIFCLIIGSAFAGFPLSASSGDFGSIELTENGTDTVAAFVYKKGSTPFINEGGIYLVCGVMGVSHDLNTTTNSVNAFAFNLTCTGTATACATEGTISTTDMKHFPYSAITLEFASDKYSLTAGAEETAFTTAVTYTESSNGEYSISQTFTTSEASNLNFPTNVTENLRCYYKNTAGTANVNDFTSAIADISEEANGWTLIKGNSALFTITAAIAGLFLQVLY
mmetsp:Transcript_12659/g.11215  ORF Transcript_12659/g.11215 Transcript_12659/m.11215 type:complete len:230 (+) Transcript_12659:2-691(+)